MEIDISQIRVADAAQTAFNLTSSFIYQINIDLLNPHLSATLAWDFEIPHAFKQTDGFFHVFAGWQTLQRPFISLLPKNKKVCIRVYNLRPRLLEDMAWQYVLHILSRCLQRDKILGNVSETVSACSTSILKKITKPILSNKADPAVMQLCSETRQSVRTQVKKLASAKNFKKNEASK
jgi:hypothetical protein